ncbi:hypothetical protein STEG23_009893, partial [Scotinomys teguina]
MWLDRKRLTFRSYRAGDVSNHFEMETSRPEGYKVFVEFRGILMDKRFIKYWDDVETFLARPDDVVIVTYPKSGTTWVSEIVYMICKEGDVEKCKEDAIFNRVPFLECRNEDLINVLYGSWYDHVKSWWKKSNNSRILFVFYEDMIEDIRREVIKLIEFLGKKPSEELVDKIIQHTSFQEMKNIPFTNFTTVPENAMNHEVSPFMRKDRTGKVLWGVLYASLQMDKKLDVFRRELVDVQGIPLFWSIAEQWSQVESFEARPDDLLISTYPKSGTTWISEILDLIYNNGDAEKCKRDAIYKRVPFMELIIPGLSN